MCLPLGAAGPKWSDAWPEAWSESWSEAWPDAWPNAWSDALRDACPDACAAGWMDIWLGGWWVREKHVNHNQLILPYSGVHTLLISEQRLDGCADGFMH